MGEGKMNSSVKKQLKFYFDYWKWAIVIPVIVLGLQIFIFKQIDEVLITTCCFLGMMISVVFINQFKLFPYIISMGCSRKDYFKSWNVFNLLLMIFYMIMISIANFNNGMKIENMNLVSEFNRFSIIFMIVIFLNFLSILSFNIGKAYGASITFLLLSIPITFRYKIYNYINLTRHDTRQGSLEILVCLVLGIGFLFLSWLLIKKSEINN